MISETYTTPCKIHRNCVICNAAELMSPVLEIRTPRVKNTKNTMYTKSESWKLQMCLCSKCRTDHYVLRTIRTILYMIRARQPVPTKNNEALENVRRYLNTVVKNRERIEKEEEMRKHRVRSFYEDCPRVPAHLIQYSDIKQ